VARSVTLGQLWLRAQQLSDIGDDASGGSFIEYAEWTRIIDQAYCELYELLAASGLYFYESTTTLTTTGAATVNLPADHYQTIGVDYSYGNCWYSLQRLSVRERNTLSGLTNSPAIGYRVVGSVVTLYPTPPSGQSYRLVYVPAPTSLIDGATSLTVDGVAGWDEYIVVDAAIRAKLREESDTSALERRKADLRQRIIESAELREVASPSRVIDIYGDEYPGLMWGDRDLRRGGL
jgi:hypothetical protein